MHQPERLFDVTAFQQEHFPKQDMLAAKVNGTWVKHSTAAVIEQVNKLSSGLLQLGISGNDLTAEGQDKISIISQNRPEWIMADLAAQQIGAVVTPLYPTISEHEIEFMLTDAQVKLVFVSDQGIYEKIAPLLGKVPSLQHVFSFDNIPGVRHWTEVAALAQETDQPKIQAIREQIKPEHLVSIIYTSGTTGTPKGVMLTHHNVMSNIEACQPYLPVNADARALSFLPLNHIFERMVTYLFIRAGVTIYYAENMDTIADNLREVQPTIFTTVPRLLEKVYERIMARGLALKGIKRGLFFWAVNLGKEYEINKPLGSWYKFQLKLANKLIFSKWREALGGRVQAVVTGAAACQVRLLRIFTSAGIPILEGYGLTETSPVISVNRFQVEGRMFGTVGPIISGVEVKIAEDGEILCKGPNISVGYYKRPDLTDAAITEGGWFHTGDIGVLVNDKFLKITDRKKELFKTSGGKFVAPQPIENKFRESIYIEQLMVVGEDRKFTGALIVPSFHNLRDWFQKKGLAWPGNEKAVAMPEVVALYQQTVDRYNQYFSHIEQIKRFRLLPQEWTVDSGEMTPTLKLKRKIIQEKYKNEIEQIYAQS